MIIKKESGIPVTEHKKIVRNRMRPYELYGAREGPSSVHLVLSWPQHSNSWERGHKMSICGNVILTRGNVILCGGHKILICGNVILTRGNLILCGGHMIVLSR